MTNQPTSSERFPNRPASANQNRLSRIDFLLTGGLFLVALTLPLIDLRLPNSLGGIRLSDFLILIVGGFYFLCRCCGALFGWSLRRWRWPLGWPWAIFLIIILLSSILSPWPVESVKYGSKTIIFVYFFYVALPVNVLDSWRKWRWVLWGIILGGGYSALGGLWSLIGQDWSNIFFRIQPTAIFGQWWLGSNHNLLAEFLVISNFFLLAARQFNTSRRWRRCLDILFILSLAITLLTFSRAAWLVSGLQLFLWWFSVVDRRRKIGWAIAALLAVVILLPLYWRMDSLQSSNFSSTENRLLLSQIATDGLIARPILGWGSGQYIRLVENNLRFRAKYGEPIDSHGLVQKVAAENGILGLVALIVLVGSLLAYWYRLWRRYGVRYSWVTPLILGAVGGLFFQFFNTSYYKGRVWLPIALTLAAGRLLGYYDQRRKK